VWSRLRQQLNITQAHRYLPSDVYPEPSYSEDEEDEEEEEESEEEEGW
jgi:hypothetical protein